MSRVIDPDRLKQVPCKIGTIPRVVIVDGRCRIAVGKEIRVREPIHGSRWQTVKVWKVNPDGYFFAERA